MDRAEVAVRARPHARTMVAGSARDLIVALFTDPRRRGYVAALVVTLGLIPVALLPPSSPIYAGIATIRPTVYTYTIAVMVTVAVLVITAWRVFLGGLLPWLPFLVWLFVIGPIGWALPARALSGVLHLCLGVLAFAIGVAVHRLDRHGNVLQWTFMAVAWVQLFAIGMAVLGWPLRRITGAQALDIHGRATGLTSHPGELAKVLLFCGLCTLALSQRTRAHRWAVWLTLGAVLAGVSLAQSRAVLAAVVAMVALFMLVQLPAGRWQRHHLVPLGIVGVLAAASIPWLVRRFATDPNGGARDHVTLVALRVIREHPWFGVGPNGYVAVAGQFDRLTQTGVPVHNIFLLSAAELGVLGAVCLWLPFGLIAVRAVRETWRSRGTEPTARLVVSALPGFLLVAVTGWGLLEGAGFLMLCLVAGYFGTGLRRGGKVAAHDVD